MNEFKVQLKSILLCTFVLTIISAYTLYEYNSMLDGNYKIMDIFNSYPRIIRIILGMDKMYTSNFFDYYRAIYFRFCIVTFTHACILGSTVLSRDEENKINDFIFTKPISRQIVIYGKIFASVLILLMFSVLVFAFLFMFTTLKLNSTTYLFSVFLTIVNLFFNQILYLAFSIYMSVLFKSVASALNYSLSFLVATFTLSVFIEYTTGFEFLKYFTPFKFFTIDADFDIISLKTLSLDTMPLDIICLAITFFIIFICCRLTLKNINERDFAK